MQNRNRFVQVSICPSRRRLGAVVGGLVMIEIVGL